MFAEKAQQGIGIANEHMCFKLIRQCNLDYHIKNEYHVVIRVSPRINPSILGRYVWVQ